MILFIFIELIIPCQSLSLSPYLTFINVWAYTPIPSNKKMILAFAEYLVAARVNALFLSFFLFFCSYSVTAQMWRKWARTKKKEETGKKGGDKDEEGNLSLIRKKKRERGNQSSIGSGKRKRSFFQDTGQCVCVSLLSSFLCRKKKKTRTNIVFFLFLLLLHDGTAMSLSVNFLLSLPLSFSLSLLSICMCVQYVVY